MGSLNHKTPLMSCIFLFQNELIAMQCTNVADLKRNTFDFNRSCHIVRFWFDKYYKNPIHNNATVQKLVASELCDLVLLFICRTVTFRIKLCRTQFVLNYNINIDSEQISLSSHHIQIVCNAFVCILYFTTQINGIMELDWECNRF